MPSVIKTLFASATVSADGTQTEVQFPPFNYTGAVFRVKVTVTGTSPTLNAYVQQALANNAGTDVWTDYASATQLTAASECWMRTPQQNAEEVHAASDAALTAGAIRGGPIPHRMRVKFDVGGTSPVFPGTEVRAELYY